jgi:hypothetical protein
MTAKDSGEAQQNTPKTIPQDLHEPESAHLGIWQLIEMRELFCVVYSYFPREDCTTSL